MFLEYHAQNLIKSWFYKNINLKAKVEDKIDENQKNLEKKYHLGCYDSLINKPSLMQLKLKEDIKIIGVCAEGC